MHTYRCPFCAARVEVATDLVGRGVACTECGRPFLVEAPAGVLVEEADGAWRPVVRGLSRAGESTVATLHPSPFRGAPLQTLALGALAGAGLAAVIWSFFAAGAGRSSLLGVGLFCLVIGALGLGWSSLVTRFETLEITTRRSIWTRGILNRNSSEVEHEDIRNIQVRQGLLDRMTGVGMLAVSSAGQDEMEIEVRGLRDPERLVALVRRYQAGDGTGD